MREVVSTIAGIILSLTILYFAIPMLSSTKVAESPLLNASDPTIALSQSIGDGLYGMLPLVSVVTAVILLIAYALKREAWE